MAAVIIKGDERREATARTLAEYGISYRSATSEQREMAEQFNADFKRISENGGTEQMKVIYKTPAAEDSHLEYELAKTRLTLNDELSVKLDKYERDEDAHLDICQDCYGNLVLGVIPGLAQRYAAQIDIPARTYHDEDSGEVNDDGEPIIRPVADPFNVDNVTLTLWEMEV